MPKAKKQKDKFETRVEKIWFDEEHSLPDHDSNSRKARKKNHRKERRKKEEYYFSADLKNKARYKSKKT